MQVTVQFDPSDQADVQRAIDAVTRHRVNGKRATTPSAAAPGTPPPTAVHDVVRFHRQMAPNESRRFLEALTDKPLTFGELAKRMPKKGGQLHGAASMRAIYRNIKRQEKALGRSGGITSTIVQSNFAKYDVDGGGRYSLTADALAALDAHLNR